MILTHLHWDHCGAATSLAEDGDFRPTFPNAQYYVQRKELAAARSGVAEGDDGYNPADYEPLLEAGVLVMLDGDGEVLPGVNVRLVGGHSAGLQIAFIGEASRAVYLSDLVPTATQLPLDCVLSYDLNIAELKAAKALVLDEAVRRRELLLFVHAPRARAGYLLYRADGTPQLEAITL